MTMPDASTLIAIGVSLVVAGIMFRGFASQTRRDLARRKEHQLDQRKAPGAYMVDELAKPPGWFDRNLGLIANLVLVAGVVLSVIGYIRR